MTQTLTNERKAEMTKEVEALSDTQCAVINHMPHGEAVDASDAHTFGFKVRASTWGVLVRLGLVDGSPHTGYTLTDDGECLSQTIDAYNNGWLDPTPAPALVDAVCLIVASQASFSAPGILHEMTGPYALGRKGLTALGLPTSPAQPALASALAHCVETGLVSPGESGDSHRGEVGYFPTLAMLKRPSLASHLTTPCFYDAPDTHADRLREHLDPDFEPTPKPPRTAPPKVKATLRRAQRPLNNAELATRAGVAPPTARRTAANLVARGEATQHQQGGVLHTVKTNAKKMTSTEAAPLVLAALQGLPGQEQTRVQLAKIVGCSTAKVGLAAASLVARGKVWQCYKADGEFAYVAHKPNAPLPPVGAVFESPTGRVGVVVWVGSDDVRLHCGQVLHPNDLALWLRVDLDKREQAQTKIVVPHVSVNAHIMTSIFWTQNHGPHTIGLDRERTTAGPRGVPGPSDAPVGCWRTVGGIVAAIALARYQATRVGCVLKITPMDVGRVWATHLTGNPTQHQHRLEALATPSNARNTAQWKILWRCALATKQGNVWTLTALGVVVVAALTAPQPSPAPRGPSMGTLTKWGQVRGAVVAGHDTPTDVATHLNLPQVEVNNILQILVGYGLLGMAGEQRLKPAPSPVATIVAVSGLTTQRWAVGAVALVCQRTHDKAPVWFVDSPWGNLATGPQGPHGPALALWQLLTGKNAPALPVAPVMAPGGGLVWRTQNTMWTITARKPGGVWLNGTGINNLGYGNTNAALAALRASTTTRVLSPWVARIIF